MSLAATSFRTFILYPLLVIAFELWLNDGVLRLQSTSLLNYDSGARSRVTFTRKSDSEVVYQLELAPGGKDFVTFVTSKMTRK